MEKKSRKVVFWVVLAVIVVAALIFTLSNQNVDQNVEQQEQQEQTEELSSEEAAEKLDIGIVQIAEHPALDAARNGFIDALAEKGYKDGENITYDIQNAQNDLSTANTIANKFKRDKPDLVLAVATPAAQAAASAMDDIPILITATTDPLQVGVESLDKPGINVSGTSDLTPIKKQIELITKIAPDAEVIGTIYNSGESNSEMQLDIAKDACEEYGLELVEATADTTSAVLQAANSLAKKDVDVLYIWTDNTVVAALESVVKVAEEEDIPLIAGEKGSVEKGALATVGIDYYELGKQTGNMAVKVIEEDAKVENMPIQYYNGTPVLTVNEKAMERMSVDISEDLLQDAEIINKSEE